MNYIPCIICGKRVQAKDDRAIVKICSSCKTEENIAKVKKMSLEEMEQYRDAWLANGFDKIPAKCLHEVKEDLPEQPTEEPPKTTLGGNVILNEFGEPL